MAHFKSYITAPVMVKAAKISYTNIRQVARLCGGMLVEDPEAESPFHKYIGIDVPLTKVKSIRAVVGWYLVRHHEKDGGGYSVYPPDVFAAKYETTRPQAEDLDFDEEVLGVWCRACALDRCGSGPKDGSCPCCRANHGH